MIEAEFQPHDVAVVLGARVGSDGGASRALARRAGHAITLAAHGRVRLLLLSGGGPGRRSEAALMGEQALAAGISADRLVFEEASRNTVENARFSAPLLRRAGAARVLLVSDGWHLPRALLCFRAFGIAATAAPAPAPDLTAAEWTACRLREAAALGLTLWRLRGARP